MKITLEQAAQWFENRAKDTPMPATKEMFHMAAEALWERAERENPRPLTPEELRGMIGEPVWTVGVSFNNGTWAGWDIVERVDDECCAFGFSCESPEWYFYNVSSCSGVHCNNGWIAYRHKPKEVQG